MPYQRLAITPTNARRTESPGGTSTVTRTSRGAVVSVFVTARHTLSLPPRHSRRLTGAATCCGVGRIGRSARSPKAGCSDHTAPAAESPARRIRFIQWKPSTSENAVFGAPMSDCIAIELA